MRPFLFPAACALALLLPAFAASAATPYVELEKRLTPDQMHATGLDTLSPAQRAALDAILRGDAERSQADAEARIAQAQHDGAEPPASARAGAKVDEGRFVGFMDAPIRSRVKGTLTGWEPGSVFVLENGQQWKVLKGSLTLRKPLESPEIMLVPGIAGRWFLQIDEDTPRPRVYRID